MKSRLIQIVLLALGSALPSLLVSPAQAQVLWTETPDFSRNQRPTGWQDGPTPSEGPYDFANGRVNAYTSSRTNNNIAKDVVMPTGTTRLEIKYRGNTNPGGQGAAQQVFVVFGPTQTLNFGHGYGTWAPSGQMLGYIASSATGPARTVEQAMTRVADTYDYTIGIEAGRVTFRGVRVSDGALAFDLSANFAGLQPTAVSQIWFNVNNWGASAATWINAIQITASGTGAGGGASTLKMVNTSTRVQVGTGANVLITGLVLSGTGSKSYLVRAVGPTLATFGVGGVLGDPMLAVFDGSNRQVASNDNWDSSLVATFRSVGAFSLPEGSRDAALMVTLTAGSYTFQISGASGTSGVAMVEVYEMP